MWRALVSLVLGLGCAAPVLAQERAIAIRGGTVLPVGGAPIPNGVVVMRGGKIVAKTSVQSELLARSP